jgi:hypothetical protein
MKNCRTVRTLPLDVKHDLEKVRPTKMAVNHRSPQLNSIGALLLGRPSVSGRPLVPKMARRSARSAPTPSDA